MKTLKTFEDEFNSLIELLGENSSELFIKMGQPDDIDETSARSFVSFQENHSHFGFNGNSIFYVSMPIIDSFGHTLESNDEYYSFKGLRLGMTKEEVVNVWGEPATKGDYIWNLVRISISNGNEVDLSITFGEKEEDEYYLSSFVARLVEKPKAYSQTSKNQSKSGCFVATACYGDYNATEVLVLRSYRDNVLLNTFLGKIAVKLYYFISPPIAKLLEKSELLKGFVRNNILAPIVLRLKRNNF